MTLARTIWGLGEGENTMPYYLLQASYTGEGWAAQVRNPRNVADRLRPIIESVGGSLDSVFYTFGDFDIVAICQFPDNISAGAVSIAAAAGGAVKMHTTTPLMTVDEGMEMMRKAGATGYRPPAA